MHCWPRCRGEERNAVWDFKFSHFNQKPVVVLQRSTTRPCTPPATLYPHYAAQRESRTDRKQASLGGRRSGGGSQEPVQKQRAPHASSGQEQPLRDDTSW